MGKRVAAVVLDQALNYVKNNCDLMVACNAEPTTYAEAFSTFALADVAMVPGDFTLGAGIGSGVTPRRLVVSAKPGVLIDVSGTVNHVALLDTMGSVLLLVTTTAPTPITANGNNKLNIPAWSEELSAPV